MTLQLRMLAPLALLVTAGCDRGAESANADAANVALDDSAEEAADGTALPRADIPSFVESAAASDMYEIEAGKLGSDKASNPDVKSFAEMLVTDHTKSSAEMKAAASQARPGLTPLAALPADKQAKIDALKAASGEEFDRLFLTQQVEAHTAALQLLEAYASGGEAQSLKDFAAKTAPVVKAHLEKAKSLQK